MEEYFSMPSNPFLLNFTVPQQLYFIHESMMRWANSGFPVNVISYQKLTITDHMAQKCLEHFQEFILIKTKFNAKT